MALLRYNFFLITGNHYRTLPDPAEYSKLQHSLQGDIYMQSQLLTECLRLEVIMNKL